MYRLIVESLLGLRLEVDRLRVEPLLPDDWQGFRIRYRHHQTVYVIDVQRGAGAAKSEVRIVCDGAEQQEPAIIMQNDGKEHHVVVEISGGRPKL